MLVEDYIFESVGEIKPVRSEDGTVERYFPQGRYANEANLALNQYGSGPFCKFSIPSGFGRAGVYLIVVSGSIRYVGECENLSARFNMGYGNISPRNCFKGGQETNCRVNALIWEATSRGAVVELWYHPTNEYKQVERHLRARLRADWNRA
jgi:hypothetical protein